MRTDTLTGRHSRSCKACRVNSRSKHSTSTVQRAGSASAAILLAVLGTAHALPQNGQVVAGTGTVAQAGVAMTVTQTSPKLAINWQGFDIAAGQSVNFAQPGASSIVLNRVLGQNPTSILGNLTANGQVFVVNPAGIVFGAGAQVNVGGLVASSHPITDADFLAGTYRFAGSGGGGAVVNQGNITATDGGYVALIGPKAQNGGSITANLGTALLAGGDQVTLQLGGSSLLGYTIDRGALIALAENQQSGSIRADGGKVILSAQGANQLATAVVNNDGVIEARTIGQSGGVIQLLGDMAVGQVNQNFILDASVLNGVNGGRIETAAAKVTIANKGFTTTEALAGQGQSGNWLIKSTDFIIGIVSDLSPNALQSGLARGNVTVQTVSGGGGGNITVRDTVAYNSANRLTLDSSRDITVNAPITNGGSGNVLLRSDSTGTGVGNVTFNGAGHVTTSGAVDLYYNPTSGNFATPNDYSGKISAATFTPWMLVNDLPHLQAMNTNLAANYALGRDIDASARNIAPFIPVGSFTGTAFSGKFDGLSRIISGLNVSSGDSAVGLFGLLNGATIANVGLAGGATTATNAVTGVAGGLAGSSFNSTIRNVFNTGSVNGQTGAGGLVGLSGSTNIQDSYASGAVTSIGGPVGGLVSIETGGAISRSYSSGPLTGQASGLVGLFLPGVTTATQNNYWYSSTPVTGVQQTGITKLDTVAQLNNPNSFGGFDFNTTWRQYDGFGAPLLKSFLKPVTITLADSSKTYDGLAGAPVQVAFSDLAATATGSGLVFQQPAQISRNAGVYTVSPKVWSNQVNGFDISYAGGKTSATSQVLQAPLTIAATGATKTYDGTTLSTATPTVTGLQPGDTVNVIESYDSRNAGARTLSSGTASISDGNGGNNYAVQYVSAGGTILQAPLAIAAVSDTKAFDGTTTSGKTPTVTGLIPGDSVSNNVEAFDAGSIGTRILNAATTVNDGNGGANYAISKSTAAGTILDGQAALDGLLSGSPSLNAIALAAAFLTDPGSRQAAARSNALDGAGAMNPTDVLAQFNDGAMLYSSDSINSRSSSVQGRQGRHTFNVEGSGIRLPDGVE